MDLKIVRGFPEYEGEVSELIISTGEDLFALMFGRQAPNVIGSLFFEKNNLFSFEHSYFALVEENLAGILVSYPGSTIDREAGNTGRLFLKYYGFRLLFKIGRLKKMDSILSGIEKTDYYISNLAVDGRYRRKGIGKELLKKAEELAISSGCHAVKLDVEGDNYPAISLYRKAGYLPEYRRDIKFGRGKTLSFTRMVKRL